MFPSIKGQVESLKASWNRLPVRSHLRLTLVGYECSASSHRASPLYNYLEITNVSVEPLHMALHVEMHWLSLPIIACLRVLYGILSVVSIFYAER